MPYLIKIPQGKICRSHSCQIILGRAVGRDNRLGDGDDVAGPAWIQKWRRDNNLTWRFDRLVIGRLLGGVDIAVEFPAGIRDLDTARREYSAPHNVVVQRRGVGQLLPELDDVRHQVNIVFNTAPQARVGDEPCGVGEKGHVGLGSHTLLPLDQVLEGEGVGGRG